MLCGPGTKERLARGNPKDQHISSHSNSLEDRHITEWKLENQDWERVNERTLGLVKRITMTSKRQYVT